MLGIQKQIADKGVEAGIITQAQADAMKSSIDLHQQYSEQAIANGQLFGPGMGGKRGGMMYNNHQRGQRRTTRVIDKLQLVSALIRKTVGPESFFQEHVTKLIFGGLSLFLSPCNTRHKHLGL